MADLGYEVVAVVDDAGEACARAADSDLVLIDLDLGGRSGGLPLSRVFCEVHNLPVVMVASRGETAADAIPDGSGVLRFPCDAGEILRVIEQTMHRGQLDGERRRLERQLAALQKQESLGVIGRRLVHDFNNLLQGVLGHAELAALDMPAGSRARDSLDRAVDSGMRAAALCRQFLACAATTSQSSPVAEVSGLVEESLPLLRAVAKRNLSVERLLEPGLPELDLPAADLRQILFNLVLNASDASAGRRARIVVSTGRRWLRPLEFLAMVGAPDRTEGEYVFLEVADEGEGVTPEVAARMFEPFFTTRFGASGLGLTAVRDLAHRHRGAVEVLSGRPRGAVFRVYVPVPRTQAADVTA